MSNSIKDQLAAAIGARKDSLKALRARIMDLVDPIPVGVKLRDYCSVCCKLPGQAPVDCAGCHGNGGGLVVSVVRVTDMDDHNDSRTSEHGLLDGNGNLIATQFPCSRGCSEYHLGSPITSPDFDEEPLRWASGKVTREIAARLPEAIARYIAECEAEATANESAKLAA